MYIYMIYDIYVYIYIIQLAIKQMPNKKPFVHLSKGFCDPCCMYLALHEVLQPCWTFGILRDGDGEREN